MKIFIAIVIMLFCIKNLVIYNSKDIKYIKEKELNRAILSLTIIIMFIIVLSCNLIFQLIPKDINFESTESTEADKNMRNMYLYKQILKGIK